MKNEIKNPNNFQYNKNVEISNDIYLKNKWGTETINISSISIPEEIQINPEENQDNNYIITTFTKSKIRNIFIILLLPIIIISEYFYRNKLYSFSLELGIKLQKYYSEIFIDFMLFITKFACDYCCFIFLVIISYICSLIQTFIYLIGLITCIYVQSLLKILYGNSRPFFDNNNLFKGLCDGGFGNPSGHALVSTFIYLTLFHYLIKIKYINENKLLKFLFGFLFSLLTLLVFISRYILGLHSLNQIIFGAFIGLWLFILIFIVIKLDKISIISYRTIYQNKKYIFIISISLLFLLFIPFWCANKFNRKLNYLNLNEKLNYNCSNVKAYKRFNNEGIFGCLIILVLIGFYYGQILFWIIFDKYYKNNLNKSNNDYYLIDELLNRWNKNKCYIFDKKENAYIFFKAVFVCFWPLIIFFFVKSNMAFIVLIIKLGLPLLLISFLFFSFGFYWLVLVFLGNKEKILNNYYQINIDDI